MRLARGRLATSGVGWKHFQHVACARKMANPGACSTPAVHGKLGAMTRLSKLLAFLAFAFLALGITSTVTGIPLRWTKGVVLRDLCSSTEAEYLCQVELVPDGTHVTAQSESDIAKGTSVELRVWHDVVSGKDSYTVVR